MEEAIDDFPNQRQHFHIPTSNPWMFQYLHIRIFYLGYSHPPWVWWFLIFGFDLHYHESWWLFSCAICLLYIFAGKFYSGHLHLKIGLSFTFELWYFYLLLYMIYIHTSHVFQPKMVSYVAPTGCSSNMTLSS